MQVVELPDDYRFNDQDEVAIRRQGSRIILEPLSKEWSRAFLLLAGASTDFPNPSEVGSSDDSVDFEW